MSTGRKKLIILSAVFLLAFAIGMMRAPAERTQAEEGGSAMTAASLPVLCTSFGDRLINPLYGYTEEMDAASLADSVFPFAESPEMTVTLLDGAAVPQSVSWEVRDEAGVRLIERGSTSAFRGSRSECSCGQIHRPAAGFRDLATSTTGNAKNDYSSNIKWAVRYFEIAELVSSWSKDPSTKVGAIIVGDKGQIIAQGYNGFPRGVEDLEERYNHRETKYKFVVHAEMNAILNALYNGSSVVGASIYIHNLPVCQECAKAIVQSGIAKVFIDTEISGKWMDAWQISKTMFKEAVSLSSETEYATPGSDR